MKKVILVLSFLVLGAYADVCTHKQYNEFVPSKSSRYKLVVESVNESIKTYIDKKSIKYNKKTHIATVWKTDEARNVKGIGVFRSLKSYNMLNGKSQNTLVALYACSGVHLKSFEYKKWLVTVPGSIDEKVLNYLKFYLGVK